MKAASRIVLLAAVVAVGGMSIVTSNGRADSAAEAKQMSFDARKSMADNLGPLAGQVVTLHLASGESLSGKVEAVGPEAVHLGALTGKEYFDALVRLDGIVAIEVRMRK